MLVNVKLMIFIKNYSFIDNFYMLIANCGAVRPFQEWVCIPSAGVAKIMYN